MNYIDTNLERVFIAMQVTILKILSVNRMMPEQTKRKSWIHAVLWKVK